MINKRHYHYTGFYNIKNLNQFINNLDDNGNKVFVHKNLQEGIIYLNSPIYSEKSFDEYKSDINEFRLQVDVKICKELLVPLKYVHKIEENYIKYGNKLDLYELPRNIRADAIVIFNALNKYMKNVALKVKEKCGIFCLTKRYNSKHFWKHYGNDFNGICIEYDIEEVIKGNNIIKAEVKYTNNSYFDPRILWDCIERKGTEKLPPFLIKALKKSGSFNVKDYFFNALVSKNVKFAIEEETRLIGIFDSSYIGSCENRKIRACPKSIYIGYKVIDEIKNYLIDYCKNNHIKYTIINENDCY